MKNRNIDFHTKLKAGEMLSMAAIILLALILGMILNSQIFAIAGVREISMEDTMFEGERLFINKLSYCTREPERGDVVVFLKNQEIGGFFDRCRISLEDIKRGFTQDVRKNRLVKRVIGLPGETIQFRNGSVFIDGVELEEPYVKNLTYPNSIDGAYQIPEDQYFMMGDNRIWSSDSRDFGSIPITSIEGKASSIIWPPSKWVSLGAEYSDSN